MNKAKIIKASGALQSKVGRGPLDERIVEHCQKVMDSVAVDFSPLATDYLDKLHAAIQKVRGGELARLQAVQAMTEPVMQLKANASMFRYNLIGNLANIMLGFLEAVDDIDETVIQIIEAHHKTLSAIVMKKMQGDGGAYGKQLEEELQNACKRYMTRKSGDGGA